MLGVGLSNILSNQLQLQFDVPISCFLTPPHPPHLTPPGWKTPESAYLKSSVMGKARVGGGGRLKRTVTWRACCRSCRVMLKLW